VTRPLNGTLVTQVPEAMEPAHLRVVQGS